MVKLFFLRSGSNQTSEYFMDYLIWMSYLLCCSDFMGEVRRKSNEFCETSSFCKSLSLAYEYSNRKKLPICTIYKNDCFFVDDYHLRDSFKSERRNQKHAADEVKEMYKPETEIVKNDDLKNQIEHVLEPNRK